MGGRGNNLSSLFTRMNKRERLNAGETKVEDNRSDLYFISSSRKTCRNVDGNYTCTLGNTHVQVRQVCLCVNGVI